MALTRLHRRIRNTRYDFLHRLTTDLAKTKPEIVIEDLNVKGMIKNYRLTRHIADVGWGEFRHMLDLADKFLSPCLCPREMNT